MPTVSDQARRATDRDRTRRLRDRSVRQPLPGAAARPRGTVRRRIRPDTGRAVVRCLRGRRLHPAALGAARLDDRRARPQAGRGLGAPDAGPWARGTRSPTSTRSRTVASRSASRSTTPTARSTPTRRSRRSSSAKPPTRAHIASEPQDACGAISTAGSSTDDGSWRTAAAWPRSRSSHAGRTRSTSRRSGTSDGSTSWTAARWTVSRACC